VTGYADTSESRSRACTVIVFAGGSGGDVYPLSALAKKLRENGHEVVFATNSYFEEIARRSNLEFRSLGSSDEYLSVLRHPELWQYGKGFRVVADSILKSLPEVHRIISERYVPGRCLVVCASTMPGPAIVCEKLGAPWASVHVEVVGLRSVNESSPAFPEWMKPVIRPLRKLIFAALDRWFFDPILLPKLNAFRSQLGLPPARRGLIPYSRPPELQIGLFPDWFHPPQVDWPSNTHLVGFPLSDAVGSQGTPEQAARFLDHGEPPIVFTWGTAIIDPGKLVAASVEVCRLMGRRGILLGGFSDHVPGKLPETVRHFTYVPLSLLLPRSSALIHHGGIGTMSVAFAAGIPQLVTPFNLDHPFNAAHLRRLGAGDSIAVNDYQPKRVARKLEKLLASPSVIAQCKVLQEKIRPVNAIGDASRLLESVMRDRLN